MQRWQVMQDDISVVYRSGRKHIGADCLSRDQRDCGYTCATSVLASASVNMVVLENINSVEEQPKDQTHLSIIEYLLGSRGQIFSGTARAAQLLSVVDGVFCRRNFDQTGREWPFVALRNSNNETRCFERSQEREPRATGSVEIELSINAVPCQQSVCPVVRGGSLLPS